MKTIIKNILLLFTISLFISCSSYGDKEDFNGTEVYYKNGTTKEEAKKLGDFLVRSEFADGNPKSVQIVKNEETGNYVFRMVTNEKAQTNKTYEILFKALAMQVSDSVFKGKPVDFDVCNNVFESVKYLPFKESN
tara:strand:- start:25958 stop:26362 length:405 start_codon:yes stop_codon:yes gene_type:complete